MVNRDVRRQGDLGVPELPAVSGKWYKFMGKRDTEQSLHLASPCCGF